MTAAAAAAAAVVVGTRGVVEGVEVVNLRLPLRLLALCFISCPVLLQQSIWKERKITYFEHLLSRFHILLFCFLSDVVFSLPL